MQQPLRIVYIELKDAPRDQVPMVSYYSASANLQFEIGAMDKGTFQIRFPAKRTFLLNVHPFIKENFPDYPFIRMEGTAPKSIKEFRRLVLNPISEYPTYPCEKNEILFIKNPATYCFKNQSGKVYKGIMGHKILASPETPFIVSIDEVPHYSRTIIVTEFEMKFLEDICCSVSLPWSTGPVNFLYIEEDIRRMLINQLVANPSLKTTMTPDVLKRLGVPTL